ncbi:gamma-aminobutyric acid receptor alpha-like [Penaeus indicus]|uniref:gamma-aminobutyric acid receptor alpha-like n=1 Tax=Penaeus indicus TaxID=29960 RepID=UPI00300CBD6E
MKKIHRSFLAFTTFILAAIFSQCKGSAVQTTIRPTSFTHSRKNLPQFSFRGGSVRPITPTKNISSLLDNLLKNYDQKLRPSFGGKPTTIEIDIEVRSMSQISEMDMTYSMDCYFRQSWVDERLAFSDLDEAFTLSVAVLEKLWKPDTFIYNGKRSHVHLITTPNKFIRLYQNGRILYSSRMTINAICPMNLHDFPMDTQHCPLRLGSFAYTTRDVLYKWNQARQVVIAPDLMLSQFDLIAAPSGTENTTRRGGEFSTLMASFYLQRNMGNFLIQVYGPCMLLVVLSWVSFWLNREATSDRISLGITTVLTMTFLGLEARTDLPKVSYSTALDLFVWLSYGFIFATIIEFAFVHVFTKVGSGEVYLSEPSSLVGSDGGDMEWNEESEVSYSTALDLFVWLSYGFIFATIIEFAFVHVFTKVGSGEVYLSEPSSLVGSDGGGHGVERGVGGRNGSALVVRAAELLYATATYISVSEGEPGRPTECQP